MLYRGSLLLQVSGGDERIFYNDSGTLEYSYRVWVDTDSSADTLDSDTEITHLDSVTNSHLRFLCFTDRSCDLDRSRSFEISKILCIEVGRQETSQYRRIRNLLSRTLIDI